MEGCLILIFAHGSFTEKHRIFFACGEKHETIFKYIT